MRFKESRPISFLVIFFVYAAASAAGIILYTRLPWNFALSLFVADVAATVVTFLFSLILKNASVYDPYWSVAPIVILVSFAVNVPLNLPAVLLLTAVCLWGVRLTANWAYTFRNLTVQDWRYTHYQELTGLFYPAVNFFGIHLMPTVIVYLCVLPAVFVMQGGSDASAGTFAGFALSVCAVILQGTADFQMHSFRAKKTGGFIRSGVWRYSRHPNYLGEILMWWGVAVCSVFSLQERIWWLFAGALVNTALFLFISIPLADSRQSKKEGFAEYKDGTRMLLPLPRLAKNSDLYYSDSITIN